MHTGIRTPPPPLTCKVHTVLTTVVSSFFFNGDFFLKIVFGPAVAKQCCGSGSGRISIMFTNLDPPTNKNSRILLDNHNKKSYVSVRH
jgi:hypothetical protein